MFAPGNAGDQDFLEFLILRYVGAFCVGFFRSTVVYLKLGSRLTFFCVFLHFLQKYRCVPKIGFSADISIDILIYIYIDIYIDIFIDISIDILTDIFIDIFIDILTDIFIDILTDKEGGGRRKEEGSGPFLKI